MWKNERQAGETTGNKKSAGGSWICDTGLNVSVVSKLMIKFWMCQKEVLQPKNYLQVLQNEY
jgi:hypothetical protein